MHQTAPSEEVVTRTYPCNRSRRHVCATWAAAIGMDRDLAFANEIYFTCRSLIRSPHAHSRFLLWDSRAFRGQWTRKT